MEEFNKDYLFMAEVLKYAQKFEKENEGLPQPTYIRFVHWIFDEITKKNKEGIK